MFNISRYLNNQSKNFFHEICKYFLRTILLFVLASCHFPVIQFASPELRSLLSSTSKIALAPPLPPNHSSSPPKSPSPSPSPTQRARGACRALLRRGPRARFLLLAPGRRRGARPQVQLLLLGGGRPSPAPTPAPAAASRLRSATRSG